MLDRLAATNPVMEHSALVIGLYAVASIIAFVLYAFDKSAARQSRRRIPEATLHLWSLLGGWPGALAAQQVFRHKTRKLSFQIVFWLTVLVNSAALAWALATSQAESLRDSPPPSNLPTITPRSRSRDDR